MFRSLIIKVSANFFFPFLVQVISSIRDIKVYIISNICKEENFSRIKEDCTVYRVEISKLRFRWVDNVGSVVVWG